jgi:iron(III) transport system permease protein
MSARTSVPEETAAAGASEPTPDPVGDRRTFRLPSSRTLLAIAAALIVLYLVVTPGIFMLGSVFQTSATGLPLTSESTWTFDNVTTVFSDGRTWELLARTLFFALSAVLLGGSIAVALAWLTERTDLPFPRVIFVLVIATAGLPGIIQALAWATILNPTAGPVNDLLGVVGLNFNPYSLAGMVIVQALEVIPVAFLLIAASLRNMNPVLEEAAAASGARSWTTFRLVSLPMFMPAALGAFIYAFVNTVDAVAVPLILGLPANERVLSIQVWLSAQPVRGLPQYGIASTYALILVALSLLPLFFYKRIMSQASTYATITGKGFRPRLLGLGPWKWPAFILTFGFVLMQAVLPVLMLFWSSIQPYYDGFGPDALERTSWSAWTSQLGSGKIVDLVLTTAKIGALAGLFTIVVAILASWVAVRSRSRTAKWLDMAMFFPQLLPGIVIALAVLLLYLVLPLGIYGTMWLLVAGFVVKSLPLASRVTTPGVAQVGVSLEEAAAVSGAKLRHIWMFVLAPLLKGTLTTGFLLVFMGALQNLSLPLLLGGGSGDRMLAEDILEIYQNAGDTMRASVLCIVMVVMTSLCAIAMRVSDRRPS